MYHTLQWFVWLLLAVVGQVHKLIMCLLSIYFSLCVNKCVCNTVYLTRLLCSLDTNLFSLNVSKMNKASIEKGG